VFCSLEAMQEPQEVTKAILKKVFMIHIIESLLKSRICRNIYHLIF
jgi:hypothetical protein